MVTTQFVADHVGKVKILDASWHMPALGRNARKGYEEKHIPGWKLFSRILVLTSLGAQFFDIDAVADRNTTLPHMLPKPDEFGDAVGMVPRMFAKSHLIFSCAGQLGISNSDAVVVYNSGNLLSAARVWWTFQVRSPSPFFVLV